MRLRIDHYIHASESGGLSVAELDFTDVDASGLFTFLLEKFMADKATVEARIDALIAQVNTLGARINVVTANAGTNVPDSTAAKLEQLASALTAAGNSLPAAGPAQVIVQPAG